MAGRLWRTALEAELREDLVPRVSADDAELKRALVLAEDARAEAAALAAELARQRAENARLAAELHAARAVSGRSEGEAALEADRRHAEVLASIGEALYSLEADGRFAFVSASALAFWGKGPAELLGRRFDEVFPQTVGSAAWHAKRHAAERGEEVRLCTRSPIAGRWIEADIYPRGDGGLTVAFRDIEERRRDHVERARAEAAPRESEARLRLAFEAADMGSWEWDLRTGRLREDAGLKRLFGLPPTTPVDDIGRLAALIHPQDRAARDAAIGRAIEEKGEYRAEFRIRRADTGELRWIAARGRALWGADGRVARLIGVDFDITERKRAEAELAESEARLRRATEAGRLATFEVDDPGAGEEARVSPGYRELYGLPPEARCDFPTILARVHPEDRAAFVADHARLGAEGGRFSAEFRVVLPDGQVRWIHARGEAEPGPDGMPRRLRGANLDVTERKAAEAALAESEARFRAMADNIPQLAWMARPDGWIFWYNRRWFDYTGTTLEEVQGWGWRAVHHPDHVDRVVERIRRAWDTGEPWEDTFPLRGRDGEYRWFLSRALPVRDAEGRITLWFGTNTDVTEQRAAGAALRESEERLRLAQRAAGIGVFDWHVPSGRVRWTEEEERLFGLAPGEFEGSIKGWARRVLPEDLAAIQGAIDAAMRRRAPGLDFAFRIRRPDGEIRHIEGSGSFEYAADGTPLRMVGVNIDVTERRRAEEQRALLMREVDHRAKNALAVVQAALRLTRAEDVPSFVRAVEGRVAALARAHTLLAQGRWEGAALRMVVEAELAAFLPANDTGTSGASAEARVQAEGPALTLAPSAAQALSMALHELATNATKHGALSAPTGRVSIRWEADRAAGLLRLRWVETGGPPVAAPPSHRGFGSRVIEATVRDQLGGRVERRWEAAGLVCAFEVPVSRVLAGGGRGGSA